MLLPREKGGGCRKEEPEKAAAKQTKAKRHWKISCKEQGEVKSDIFHLLFSMPVSLAKDLP